MDKVKQVLEDIIYYSICFIMLFIAGIIYIIDEINNKIHDRK